MELSQEYLQKLSGNKKPRVHTKEQALADEIYSYFHKDIAFPRLMNMIRRRGYQFVYEAFNLVKQTTDADNPVSLFIWKVENKKHGTAR